MSGALRLIRARVLQGGAGPSRGGWVVPPHVLLPGQRRLARQSGPVPQHVCDARALHTSAPLYRAPGLMLPATPDTYLALRASSYELHALPESSLEALIENAGRVGLAGLIGRIVADVLEHRAAHARSERQRRLLVALLSMASIHARRLPLAPDAVVRLTAALLADAGKLDELPPHAALHSLKIALSIESVDGAQHALIAPLFAHLSRTASFPLLEEGLHVIEYVLRFSDADPAWVMELVSQTVHVDGERLGKQTMQQARADGFAWRRWARSAAGVSAVSALPPDTSELMQTHALRISLWSLACRAWLRLHRARRFRLSLAQLRTALASASAAVAPGAAQPPPSALIVRGLLQAHVVNLAGAKTRNSVRAALAALRAAPATDVAHVLPGVLRLVSATAVDLDDTGTAAALVVLALRTAPDVRTLVQQLGPVVLLAAMEHLADTAQPALVELAHACAVPRDDTDVSVDLLWPEPLRPRVLVVLCAAGMADASRVLYLRWSGSFGVPAACAAPEASAAPALPIVAARGSVAWLLAEAVRALSVRGLGVALSASAAPSLPAAPSALTTSHPCVLSLVKLFALRDVSFARAVRDDFHACLGSAMERASHYDLTALAQASFLVGDTGRALSALHAVLTRGYTFDDTDMAVLLRGVADVAPDAAVGLFLETLSHQLAPSDTGACQIATNPTLYAVLLSRCVALARFDLASRVLAAAQAHGVGSAVARIAPAVALRASDDPPQAYVARACAMLRDGWTLEPHTLSWMMRTAARGLSLRNASIRGPDNGSPRSAPTAADGASLGAAMHLFCYAAERRGFVDLPTARFLLYHLAARSRRLARHAPHVRVLWTARLDRMVNALLWTRHWTGCAAYARMAGVDVVSAAAPHALPSPLARQLMLAYDALGDARGVREVLEWTRDHGASLEAHSVADLVQRSAATGAGAARTKLWWQAPRSPPRV